MKNSRFSSKKVSMSLRFTTAGSTSAWPKSGLKVAFNVRSEVIRYLTSAPARREPSRSSVKGSSASTSAFVSIWAAT